MFGTITKSISFVFAVVMVLAITPVAALAAGPQQQDQTIVDIAVADGRFTTLVAALEAADLADTLGGDGPFTVFAPTDDAFNALPAGTVESLLGDVPALSDVLLYHVVAGKVLAADVVNLTEAPTVQGQPVKITVDGSTVKVNDVQVIITDIEASNGVIHVIDAVLIPPQSKSEDSHETPTAQAQEKHHNNRYAPRAMYGYNLNRHAPRYNRGNYSQWQHNRGYYGNNRYGQNRYYGRTHYGRGYYGNGRHGHSNYGRNLRHSHRQW